MLEVDFHKLVAKHVKNALEYVESFPELHRHLTRFGIEVREERANVCFDNANTERTKRGRIQTVRGKTLDPDHFSKGAIEVKFAENRRKRNSVRSLYRITWNAETEMYQLTDREIENHICDLLPVEYKNLCQVAETLKTSNRDIPSVFRVIKSKAEDGYPRISWAWDSKHLRDKLRQRAEILKQISNRPAVRRGLKNLT
ncbi:relaxase/mobilization nuclease domain-containing protein [Alkalihalobacillus sp. TS-13]|uniref:relaxase/mobilization nuclease domain-containing protein n=1 Tax=Alkalihalobacillus sp. TS-13 TaxID=2842455 RepID=UPI001C887EF5|nr:relaxase/mobilization nuclease domain-containing protein [Alkalihalobacillus sp. TS-13]